MDGSLGWTDGWTGGCVNKCTALYILPKGYFFANLLCKCLITDLNHVFYENNA